MLTKTNQKKENQIANNTRLFCQMAKKIAEKQDEFFQGEISFKVLSNHSRDFFFVDALWLLSDHFGVLPAMPRFIWALRENGTVVIACNPRKNKNAINVKTIKRNFGNKVFYYFCNARAGTVEEITEEEAEKLQYTLRDRTKQNNQ